MNPVTLPPGAPRCPDARLGACHQAVHCARSLAAHDIGRPVKDYTGEPGWAAGACVFFLSASEHRTRLAAPAPTVHDAPRGFA